MLVGVLDLDVVEVGALLRHGGLQIGTSSRSSDLGHVTKGHQHYKEPPPYLKMIPGGHFVCAAS
jgi:hypothetical protein